ncbi:MAG TPA: DnaA/Hda family protein, partial [Acidimicrobiales bacterium]|nr:DnaA/Hda family protein [Acidimicrobiales bacterium]
MLREDVREAVWRTWFDGLEASDLADSILTLTSPSSPVRDRLEERYLSLIEQTASQVAGRDLKVQIRVRPTPQPASPFVAPRAGAILGLPGETGDSPDDGDTSETAPVEGATPGRIPAASPGGPATGPTGAGTGSTADLPLLNPRYTFDAFVIGSSNRFAHAAAQRVAESPAGSYNPLFIYGDSGLGKTHLLHAIGHYVTVNFAGKRVRYVSTETFMNDFVDAIRNSAQMQFKRRYRECDVLLVDDIQFMEGKEGLQEEFFHTFNWLYESSKQ